MRVELGLECEEERGRLARLRAGPHPEIRIGLRNAQLLEEHVAHRARQRHQPAAAGVQDCCNEVLKRLDKLDAIERMLMDLADNDLLDLLLRRKEPSGEIDTAAVREVLSQLRT